MARELSVQVSRRGEKWQYRIQFQNAKGERESISRSGYDTKKEARLEGEIAAKALGSHIICPEAVANEMRMDVFFQYWIEQYCKPNIKESTLRGYQKNLNNLILLLDRAP